MRCSDDFLWYLLKQQAEAFFVPNGCMKWSCSGRAGFMLLHLHLLTGGGEEPGCCLCCLPVQHTLAACGCQMVTVAIRYSTIQKVSFLNAPSHTVINLLILLGRAFVAVQVLESMHNTSSCLHYTVKEAGKWAQLYRTLPMLSGRVFNFIHLCPQLSVFSVAIYSSSFFSVFFQLLLYRNEATQLETSILEAPLNVTKKSVKTEKKINSQIEKHALNSFCQTSASILLVFFSLPGWLFPLTPKICPPPQHFED